MATRVEYTTVNIKPEQSKLLQRLQLNAQLAQAALDNAVAVLAAGAHPGQLVGAQVLEDGLMLSYNVEVDETEQTH